MAPVPEKDNHKESGSNCDSTWLGRTHFSRSVFHRVNNKNETQNGTVSITGETLGVENDVLLCRETNKQLHLQELVSKHLPKRSKFPRTKSEFNCTALQDENGELSYQMTCSAHTSPENRTKFPKHQPRRSLSLPFSERKHDEDDGECCSSNEDQTADDQNSDNTDQPDVGRATSWSEYFVSSGNEYAVEEAEEWMIELSELFLSYKFASGAHSRIYRGKYKDIDVAVKILRKPDDDDKISKKLEQQFVCEVNVLSRIRHRNIVKFIGACKKPPVCCIITEYLPLGSLRSYLHNQQLFPLSLKLVVDMALDIAQGMEFLHSKGVIHRDLKSENLIIADDLCVKVTDFGAAFFESECCPVSDEFGTYRWMAPEMIRGRKFSRKADVYSFGIVLWELLTGQLPFEDLSPVQAAFAVVHKNARPPLPLNCPNVLSQLMSNCWSTDPDKRPHFSEVVGLLEETRASIDMQRNMSIVQRPHKHTNGLLRCFGCGKSTSPLQ